MRRTRPRAALAALLTAALAATLAACATGSGTRTGTGSGTGRATIRAVASIDAWGSILSQLGGTRVTTTSIISSPDVDPHSYEPTTADSIAIAEASVLVVNGIGYDSWASQAAAANPSDTRRVVDVGDLVGVTAGGNPHQWYSRSAVDRVVDAITADLQAVDPAGRGYYAQRRTRLETVGFARYDALERQLRAADRGVPVGASESIASPLAATLGLDLLTPASFLRATSEGTDPAPADIATIDRQLAGRRIRVYLDNVQNSTPDVTAQVRAARAAGIPVVAITETLSPHGTSFQDWQSAQLAALQRALAATAP